MSRQRWRRLASLLFAAFAISSLAVLLFAERIAEFIIRQVGAGVPAPEAIGNLRIAFLLTGLAALGIAVIAAIVASRPVNRGLAALRTYAAARGRGEDVAPPAGGTAEVQAALAAVDMLASELRRGQERVATERDELALLLGTVSEGILQVDAGARLVHANPAARALLGLGTAQRGQPIAAFIRDAALRDLIARAARGADLSPCEVVLDDRRLMVSARPVRRTDGADGAVVTLSDLTEIRRLEGVRRDFVANVSHELKTPLTSIRGYVETLQGEELPDETRRQFLEVIRKNADRLQAIVEDLLDLSRIESGGWRPELRTVDPLATAREAWESLRVRTESRRIEFDTSGPATRVLADPRALRQVLANLLDNAIRHTPDGGRITVRAMASGEPPPRRTGDGPGTEAHGTVVIDVRDTGSGIPHDLLPRIFERFFRVDPARSRADGGTGLGLAIVRHLVGAMGGDITAESELGRGTLMRIRLPAA